MTSWPPVLTSNLRLVESTVKFLALRWKEAGASAGGIPFVRKRRMPSIAWSE